MMLRNNSNIKNIVLYLFAGMVFFVGISSCKRTKDKFMGPDVKAAPSDFSIGSFQAKKMPSGTLVKTLAQAVVTGNMMRFGNMGSGISYDYVTFTCPMNYQVTWKVTVTGQTSGAVKEITATSQDPDGVAIWDGGSSNFSFFQMGEMCKAVITFTGSTITDSAFIQIKNNAQGPKQFCNGGPYGSPTDMGVVHDGVTYNLIDNFESSPCPVPQYIRTGYVDIPDGHNSIGLDRNHVIDGTYGFRLHGFDYNNNTYLGGTGAQLLTSHARMVKTLNPDSLYFNVYIYGTGNVNTNLEIRTYEMDTLDNNTLFGLNFGSPPLSTSYTTAMQASNDQWIYDIYIDWTGWQLVSVPYKLFKPSSNPMVGGNGNKIMEPRKITSVALLLQSLPSSGATVDCTIDFLCITENGKFKP